MRRLGFLLRRVSSIWWMLLPVSMAVELATARMMAFWLGALVVRRGLEAVVGLVGFMVLSLADLRVRSRLDGPSKSTVCVECYLHLAHRSVPLGFAAS